MQSNIKAVQEKIINAISYYKLHKRRRPTSEEIFNFVNNDGTRNINFSLFKDAMRELKYQRKIHNEKRNDAFLYFIPRVPEITLKINKAKAKESYAAKNPFLPRLLVEGHDGDGVPRKNHYLSSPLVEGRSNNISKKKNFLPRSPNEEHSNGISFIFINNDDDIDDDDDVDDDDDDIEQLEGFIDKMMDKIEDMIMKEPSANIISLYEQRIFDLKSEILFLRKLTSSNNTLLKDEIHFLRNELNAKNNLIHQLTINKLDEDNTISPEIGFKIRYAEHPFNKESSKAMTVVNTHLNEKMSANRRKIEWMGDSLLKGLYEVDMNKVKMKKDVGFPSFNILDHIKPGIIPRHKGMSFNVGENGITSNINVTKMFDNFFGNVISSPFNNFSNQVTITELENDNIPKSADHECIDIKTNIKNINNEKANNNEYITDNEETKTIEVLSNTLLNEIYQNKSNTIDNLESYRGWLSLDIMDRIKPTAKHNSEENLICFGTTDLNLLKICENMSEQVNNINVKLRNYCEQRQRNIIYDGGKIDEPCLNKLPLNCKGNNLLTNTYVNRTIAT